MSLPCEDYISVQRAEAEFDVHGDTLQFYIKNGHLPGYFIDENTDRYIRVKSIRLVNGTYIIRLNNRYEGGRTGTFSNMVYAITFPVELIFIRPKEFFKLKKNTKVNANTAVEPKEYRVTPYDVTGRKGPVKKIVFSGLKAFYNQKEQLPTKQESFQDFLNFIRKQFVSKPRPEYLKPVVSVNTSGTDDSICLTITDTKKRTITRPRKYVATQFYKFRKEFCDGLTSQVTSKEVSQPEYQD